MGSLLVFGSGVSGLLGFALDLADVEAVVGQMHCLKLVALLHTHLAETFQTRPLDKELSHEDIERAAFSVTWVVEHVKVANFGELKDTECDFNGFNCVMTQVEVLKLGQL